MPHRALSPALSTLSFPLLLALVVAPGTVAAQGGETVEKILADSAEARGGAERLAQVETIVATGTAYLNGGAVEAPFRYEWKRPGRFRFELTIQGVTEVQASDGDAAWHLDPQNQPEPEPLAALELALLNDAADFLGALVDPEAKGHAVELVGATEVEGTPAWELRVNRAEGFVETIYLDREYLVEIQQVEEHPIPGGSDPLKLVTTWGDYKEVGGVMLPHYWSRHPAATPEAGITLAFESLAVNEPVEDERFRRPDPTPE